MIDASRHAMACAAMLGGLLAAGQAHAAMSTASFSTVSEDLAMSSAVQLANVRYTLVDLTPDDGISPSIQFLNMSRPLANSDFMVQASGSVYGPGWEAGQNILSLPNVAFPAGAQALSAGAPGSDSANLLNQVLMSASSTDGVSSAYMDSQNMGAAVRLTAGQVATLAQAPYASSQYLDWAMEGRAYAGIGVGGGYSYSVDDVTNHLFDPAFAGDSASAQADASGTTAAAGSPLGRAFILSPNTEVIFEGDMTLQAMANVDALHSVGLDADIARSRTVAGVAATLFRALPKDGRTWWSTEAEMFDAFDYQQAGLFTEAYMGGTPAADQSSFSLSIKNAQGTSINATFDIGVSAFFDATGTAVPEPSTWALMGLGLIGVAGVARRRQIS